MIWQKWSSVKLCLAAFVMLGVIVVCSQRSEAVENDVDAGDNPVLADQCRRYVDRAFEAAKVEVDEGNAESVAALLKFDKPEITVDGAVEPQHVCDALPVYYVGTDLGAAGRLRQKAIDAYAPWVFEARVEVRSRGWIRNKPWADGPADAEIYPEDPDDARVFADGCLNASNPPAGYECDEFPNATMIHGGNPNAYGHLRQPALSKIVKAENQDEGKFWGSTFLKGCDIKQHAKVATLDDVEPADMFLIIPVYDLGEPTQKDCNDPEEPVDPEEPIDPGEPVDPEEPIDPEEPTGSLPEPLADTRPEPSPPQDSVDAGSCVAERFDDDRETFTYSRLEMSERSGTFFVWNFDGSAAGADEVRVEYQASRGSRTLKRLSPRVVAAFAARGSNPENPHRVVAYDEDGNEMASIPCPIVSGSLDDILADSPIPADDRCTHIGTAASELLTGTEGDDFICPLQGDDVVYASGGDDIVADLAGDNRIYGEDGDDRLETGSGADRLFGGPGDDILRSKGGNDVLNGDMGDDRLSSGAGDDFVYGGEGDDKTWLRGTVASAATGNDVYYMGPGDDSAQETNGDGDDSIFLGTGSDTGSGGPGNDFIHAEPEPLGPLAPFPATIDKLDGNEGNDLLVHVTPAENLSGLTINPSLTGGPGNDLFITLDGSWDSVYFDDRSPEVGTMTQYCAVNAAPDFDVASEANTTSATVGCSVGDWGIEVTFDDEDSISGVEVTNPTAQALEGIWVAFESGLLGMEQQSADACICDVEISTRSGFVLLNDPVSG